MRKGVEKLTKQKEKGKERLKTTKEGRREVKEATEG